MGTLRKKARTKAPAPADQTPVDQVEVKDVESTAATDSSAQSLRSKKSWYGTWPKKSVASTQIARESILADRPTNGSGSDLSRFDVRRAPPTSPSESVHSTNKHVVSGEVPEMANNTNQQQSSEQTEDDAAEVANPIVESEVVGEPTHPPSTTQQSKQSDSTDLGVPGSSGWFRWLGPTTEHDGTKPAPNDENPIPVAVSLDEHVRTVPDGSPDAKVSGKPGEAHNLGDASADDAAKDNGSEPQLSQASWYQFWSSNALPRMPAKEEDIRPAASQDATVLCVAENAAKPDKGETEDVPALAGSTWAFWSGPTKQAVQDPSKDLREPAEEIATLQEPGKSPLKQLEPSQVAKEKAAKAHSKQGSRDVSDSDRPTVKPNSVAKNEVVMQTTTTSPPNLILPSVRSTYRLVEDPSILQQLARLLHIGNQIPTKHVMLAKHAPRVRKAVAIGIHGLFILRRVIGSTGTSIRFVNHAAAAIKRWADAHDSGDCEIEKIALEGEGKINERVDNLWKLLLNWIEHIRRADTIMIACHSQGVPVAIMLIAKLIEFGVVTNARIGVCAMAGVSLGPFADYKSRLLGGPAAELFEFGDPKSHVSLRYADALRVVLKYGTRITYCGSIDDQVVSLESAVFSCAEHPHIYRAVFVDGRIHAPDFIAHLVGFALKLRNLGVSDHGLIRELSAPLAGSLYTGEGHSRLYDDERVYDLAIEYALETTAAGDVPLEIKPYSPPSNANPYILPWIMRGLLEESFVKTELGAETSKLLEQFDEWKPSTKVLKDVKYRLEAVRSKL